MTDWFPFVEYASFDCPHDLEMPWRNHHRFGIGGGEDWHRWGKRPNVITGYSSLYLVRWVNSIDPRSNSPGLGVRPVIVGARASKKLLFDRVRALILKR